ncbi:MAG: C25 family cysteine peptidase, partial [Verrucomicrobiota bacterium]
MVPPFCALLLVVAVVFAPAWRVQASDSWPQIKITTQNTGLHHVTAAGLAALIGVSSNDVRDRILQGKWQLLNRGQPGRWLAGSNGLDLIFYAGALRNNYTTNNVYWLVDGTNTAPAVVNGGSPAAVSGTCYLAATNCEQDIYCRYELGTHPDSNYWYWANVVAGHPLRGKFDVTVPLDALGYTSALAQITVRVCGGSATNQYVGLTVNGTTNAAWVGAWQGAVPAVFTFNFPASLLNVGNNTIRFTALGASGTQWWLDGFVLEFPRPYTSVAGALQCGANSNAVVTMTGFGNRFITVVDVSQPLSPVVVTNLLVETNGGQWRASFAPASGVARYSEAQSGSLLTPLALEAVTPLNLASPTNRAACIIIAPAALQSSATNLASYRNAQGLETRVIPLEAIYNEFNGGLREPEALRTFLAQAHSNWQLPPAYVVLAGNGTYDYRNLLGMNDNLVPPLMITCLYGLAASDSEFGDLGGTNAPEIAVGRLPATNAVQLTAMINKIKAYEALPSPAAKQALLVADFADPGAGDFPTQILDVQEMVAPAFQATTVLPSTVVQMHNQVLAGLNAGADLMCYMG